MAGIGSSEMARPKLSGKIPEIGVGMLGYAFMGTAHSNAFKKIPYMIYPPAAIPKMVMVAGRSEDGVRVAAERFGYESYTTDWRKLVKNDRVQLFDNGGPNDAHAAPCIAAARAGKHILCEKPLARNAREAGRMLDAVVKAGVVHAVAFNYRFVPAVRLIRDLIDSNKLGQIYHFRAAYRQEWIMPHYSIPMNWRLRKKQSGSGALGDIGAHIIDLARYLVGEPRRVCGATQTFIKERPVMGTRRMERVDVDDAFGSVVEFENGALGTIEATRFAAGRKNYNVLEINAEHGSIRFNLERMNELEVFWVGEEPRDTRGFHVVNVSESYHPFWKHWWPQGHIIGWEHTFIHEIHHLLEAIVSGQGVAPYGADFEDGYKNAVICDAILASARTGRRLAIKY